MRWPLPADDLNDAMSMLSAMDTLLTCRADTPDLTEGELHGLHMMFRHVHDRLERVADALAPVRGKAIGADDEGPRAVIEQIVETAIAEREEAEREGAAPKDAYPRFDQTRRATA